LGSHPSPETKTGKGKRRQEEKFAAFSNQLEAAMDKNGLMDICARNRKRRLKPDLAEPYSG